MYEEFYGLERRPFLTVPDPGFIYWSEKHELGMSMLRLAIMTRAPLTVVTGPIGSGKTTLIRHLLNEIGDDLEVGLISNMQAGKGELLHWILMSLGQTFDDEPYVKLFFAFQKFVVEAYGKGKRVVLIVDEAQNCDTQVLEELRMLTNTNSDRDELLQIILVGQPSLRELLSDPALTQFAQRIVCDYNVDTLSEEETRAYVEHRLRVAGATAQIFEEQNFPLIHAATRGVPRLINILCDLCLIYGLSYEKRTIDTRVLEVVLRDVRSRGLYGQFSFDSEPAGDEVPKLAARRAPQSGKS